MALFIIAVIVIAIILAFTQENLQESIESIRFATYKQLFNYQ